LIPLTQFYAMASKAVCIFKKSEYVTPESKYQTLTQSNSAIDIYLMTIAQPPVQATNF